MSAVVKTITPFLDLELLLQSLEAIGCNYLVQNNEVLTDRIDYRGRQKFVLRNGRYIFENDSHADIFLWKKMNLNDQRTVSGFLGALEEKYHFFYNLRMEELEKKRQDEERIRLENQRKAFVESQIENIVSKAKEKGYSVQQEKVKGKVKLVLVRNTY